MSNIIHTITVNMDNGAYTINPPLDIHQGDKNSHTLFIKLRNDEDQAVSLNPNAQPIIKFRKNQDTVIKSYGVNIVNAYRGELSYVLGSSIVDNIGVYTVYLELDNCDCECCSGPIVSFCITISKNNTYESDNVEVAVTQEWYDKVNEFMNDLDPDKATSKAFITLDFLYQLDELKREEVCEGKLVRINYEIKVDGSVEYNPRYYVCHLIGDDETITWDETEIGGGSGTEYEAGTGIDIDENNVISIDSIPEVTVETEITGNLRSWIEVKHLPVRLNRMIYYCLVDQSDSTSSIITPRLQYRNTTAGESSINSRILMYIIGSHMFTTNETYSIGTATSEKSGFVKLGSSTVQSVAANEPTTVADRTYPVQFNSSGQAVVNVPSVANQVFTNRHEVRIVGSNKFISYTVYSNRNTPPITVSELIQCLASAPWYIPIIGGDDTYCYEYFYRQQDPDSGEYSLYVVGRQYDETTHKYVRENILLDNGSSFFSGSVSSANYPMLVSVT